MDSHKLIEQVSANGVPAPMWFVEFFKVLGFTLHAVPMNLWYAGLLVALWLHLRGNVYARRFAARLLGPGVFVVMHGQVFPVGAVRKDKDKATFVRT